MGIEIGTALAEKSKGLFSAEDWQCAKVGYRVLPGGTLRYKNNFACAYGGVATSFHFTAKFLYHGYLIAPSHHSLWYRSTR
jgi:hypothetical protein